MARRKTGATPDRYSRRKKGKVDYAYVRIDGHQIMLGCYGTAESREDYDRLVAEWLANGRRLPCDVGDSITIAELVDHYQDHAVVNLKYTVQPLVGLYGSLPVTEFGIGKLKVLRSGMVDQDSIGQEDSQRSVRPRCPDGAVGSRGTVGATRGAGGVASLDPAETGSISGDRNRAQAAGPRR